MHRWKCKHTHTHTHTHHFSIKGFFSSTYIIVMFAGKNVVVALIGGNIDTTLLGRCLDRGLAVDNRLCRFVVRVTDRPGEGWFQWLIRRGLVSGVDRLGVRVGHSESECHWWSFFLRLLMKKWLEMGRWLVQSVDVYTAGAISMSNCPGLFRIWYQHVLLPWSHVIAAYLYEKWNNEAEKNHKQGQ